MERPNILGKTRDTITKFKSGSVFSASDFSDISESIANKLKDTSTKTIDHVLALYNTFATV